MSDAPRFHLDESMPLAVAEGLKRRGLDCSTSQDQGLRGATDLEQLAFANRETRIIITRDRDFLRLTSNDSQHPGVIHWNMKHHFGQLIHEIDQLSVVASAEDFRGTVHYF